MCARAFEAGEGGREGEGRGRADAVASKAHTGKTRKRSVWTSGDGVERFDLFFHKVTSLLSSSKRLACASSSASLASFSLARASGSFFFVVSYRLRSLGYQSPCPVEKVSTKKAGSDDF